MHKTNNERESNEAQILLALDPGTRHTGYALLRGETLLTCGVWKLGNASAHPQLSTIYSRARFFIEGLSPDVLVIEWPSPVPVHKRGNKSKTLRRLHRVAQTIQSVGEELGIPSFTYEPTTIRRVVLGNGWATKEQVANFLSIPYPELSLLLKQDRKWKETHWRHAFDALAAARCHLQGDGT